MEIEAELWANSSNPISQIFGEIRRLISLLFGFKKHGFIVITNKRVVEVSSRINCYVFNTGKEVKYLLPSSVKEIGYTKHSTCCCFCPAYYLYYEGMTQKTSVMLKNVDEKEAQETVSAFYSAITQAQISNE